MLLKEFPRIALSISTTTRPRRPYEKEGTHYHFVDPRKEFALRVDQRPSSPSGRTCTTIITAPKSRRSRATSPQGKHILFDIDVQGAMSLRALYPKQTLLIFIHPPSIQALEERLLQAQGRFPERY